MSFNNTTNDLLLTEFQISSIVFDSLAILSSVAVLIFLLVLSYFVFIKYRILFRLFTVTTLTSYLLIFLLQLLMCSFHLYHHLKNNIFRVGVNDKLTVLMGPEKTFLNICTMAQHVLMMFISLNLVTAIMEHTKIAVQTTGKKFGVFALQLSCYSLYGIVWVASLVVFVVMFSIGNGIISSTGLTPNTIQIFFYVELGLYRWMDLLSIITTIHVLVVGIGFNIFNAVKNREGKRPSLLNTLLLVPTTLLYQLIRVITALLEFLFILLFVLNVVDLNAYVVATNVMFWVQRWNILLFFVSFGFIIAPFSNSKAPNMLQNPDLINEDMYVYTTLQNK